MKRFNYLIVLGITSLFFCYLLSAKANTTECDIARSVAIASHYRAQELLKVILKADTQVDHIIYSHQYRSLIDLEKQAKLWIERNCDDR